MWTVPLWQSIQALKQRFHWSVLGCYLILLTVCLWVLLMLWVAPIQSMMMRKFHPPSQPFGRWTILQLFPSMYNFNNQIIFTFPISLDNFNQRDLRQTHGLTVNHFPMRMLYFIESRENVFSYLPSYIYLKSHYQKREIVTSYLVTHQMNAFKINLLNIYERAN